MPAANAWGPTLGFFQAPAAETESPDALALSLDAFPNPSRGGVTPRLQAPIAAAVSGEIVDALGRTVARLPTAHASEGTTELASGLTLAPGSYLVVVRAVGADGSVTRAVRRLSVVR